MKSRASLPFAAVLIDMFHAEATHVEAHAQILRAKHIMQVSHMGELLGHQSAVERVESFHPVVLTLDVCLHEADIRCEVFEQRSGVSPTENGDAHIGILHSKRVDHGYNHGHVAQGGKAYDEDVLTFHLFLV